MFKLAALGALGYAGYKYYQKNRDETGGRNAAETRETAVAGGPISNSAELRHPAEKPRV